MSKIAAFFDIDGTIYREGLITEVFKKIIKYELIEEDVWHNEVKPVYLKWDRREGDYDEYLLKMVDAYKQAILGVSKDSVASHKKFEEKYGLAFTLLADPERKVIEAYDVWKEKKNYGKVSMGVVRTTYLIDESGIIVRANDKVKAANDSENMLEVV